MASMSFSEQQQTGNTTLTFTRLTNFTKLISELLGPGGQTSVSPLNRQNFEYWLN